MGLLRYKILILILSSISGIYIWPRAIINLGLWNWFYYSSFIFIFYWLLMFFIDLYGIKNSTLRYKVLNLSVILSFLIEGLGFGSSIGGANTILCMIPPPSTYNGFRIAITSSFAGSILIIIYFSFEISHQVRRKKQNNRFLGKNSQEIEFRVDYPRRETTVLSYISINFLLFHISFFCPYLFGSVGCNGIPEIFILPIGIFWFIQGVINLSYQIMAKLI